MTQIHWDLAAFLSSSKTSIFLKAIQKTNNNRKTSTCLLRTTQLCFLINQWAHLSSCKHSRNTRKNMIPPALTAYTLNRQIWISWASPKLPSSSPKMPSPRIVNPSKDWILNNFLAVCAKYQRLSWRNELRKSRSKIQERHTSSNLTNYSWNSSKNTSAGLKKIMVPSSRSSQ